MIYILSYQLQTPDKDYAPLYKYIENSIGTSAVHVLRDSWWVASDHNLDVDEECEKVRKYLGEKDGVYMAELQVNAKINGWLPSNFWDWYRDNNKK